jgi:hypothetical protein
MLTINVFGCKITAFAKDGKYSFLGNLTTIKVFR